MAIAVVGDADDAPPEVLETTKEGGACAPRPPNPNECVVCGSKDLSKKYKCPRCLAKYCSLACCREHKAQCAAQPATASAFSSLSSSSSSPTSSSLTSSSAPFTSAPLVNHRVAIATSTHRAAMAAVNSIARRGLKRPRGGGSVGKSGNGGTSGSDGPSKEQQDAMDLLAEENGWKLPDAQLRKLLTGPDANELKRKLRDPQLQELITAVDGAGDRREEALVAAQRRDPRFAAFVEDTLKSLGVYALDPDTGEVKEFLRPNNGGSAAAAKYNAPEEAPFLL